MSKSIRQQVNDLLKQREYDSLLNLCQEEKQAWKILSANLYSTDEDLIWPAIEAIAMLVERWWEAGEEEKVREYIRRLFWSLNDESGGIGWNAPQTIAEIIVLIPELIDPYGSMMIDRTMEESLLVPSGLWAIGRLGSQIEPAVRFFRSTVLASFQRNDAQTLGVASWAMGEASFTPALSLLESLADREETVRIYIDGDFHEKSLGQWAKDAIAQIDSVV